MTEHDARMHCHRMHIQLTSYRYMKVMSPKLVLKVQANV